VGFAAEDGNVDTTLVGLARIELVRVCGRRESDVAGGLEGRPSCSGCSRGGIGHRCLGSDLNAERGSEGVLNAGDGVFGGVVFKKPWATRSDIETP